MNTTGIGTASNTVHLQVNGVGRTVNVGAESRRPSHGNATACANVRTAPPEVWGPCGGGTRACPRADWLPGAWARPSRKHRR